MLYEANIGNNSPEHQQRKLHSVPRQFRISAKACIFAADLSLRSFANN